MRSAAMSTASAALQRNLGRLELAAFVVIACLLAAALFERYQRVAAQAERAAVDTFIADYRGRLRLFNMLEAPRLGPAQLAALAGGNPFALFGAPVTRTGTFGVVPGGDGAADGPAYGYIGEIPSQAVAALKKGQWAFDNDAGVLVYRVEHPQGFAGPEGAPEMLRFGLRLDFADVDADGRYDPALERALGLRLDRLADERRAP